MYENIKFEVNEGIGTVTINRPKAMNALKYIYNNATIYLERKYERYQKFMPSLVKATED